MMDAMKGVASLLNQMVADDVLTDYALFGAVAQMRYTDAVVTMDADVLVGVRNEGAMDVLRPIHEYCAARGLRVEGEAIRVGSWPVQFIPVFSPLTRAAMEKAECQDLDGVPLRVVSSDYLAAIALSTGRAKDYARILALLEAGTTTPESLERLAAAHDLRREWAEFRKRFLAP
jgi:hypothetical protein